MDRMLTEEIGVSFGFGVGFFTTLLVMNHIFYLARLAIGQGMPFDIALQLFGLRVPYIIAFTAPMGVLLATVLGIGRLTDHHEISALRVCGISLYPRGRAGRPAGRRRRGRHLGLRRGHREHR